MNDDTLFPFLENQLIPKENETESRSFIERKNGKIRLRLSDGRMWCPSRQHKGEVFKLTDAEIRQINESHNGSTSFTAVDVETATFNRMICQIGIVVVKDGNIVNKIVRLVQPPKNLYDAHTINVHGITPETTQNAPFFDSVWKDIKRYFINTKIVAHNASFDEDALRKNLKYYNIEEKDIKKFVCTCELFNRTSLANLCYAYDIDLSNHHDALFDAEYCARFYLNYINHVPFKKPFPVKESHEENETLYDPLMNLIPYKNISSLHPTETFINKRFLITGSTPFDRELASDIIKQLGGKVSSGINKSLDYVILGEKPGPSKIKKLSQLTDEGCDIVKLSVDDFFYLLKTSIKNI